MVKNYKRFNSEQFVYYINENLSLNGKHVNQFYVSRHEKHDEEGYNIDYFRDDNKWSRCMLLTPTSEQTETHFGGTYFLTFDEALAAFKSFYPNLKESS